MALNVTLACAEACVVVLFKTLVRGAPSEESLLLRGGTSLKNNCKHSHTYGNYVGVMWELFGN